MRVDISVSHAVSVIFLTNTGDLDPVLGYMQQSALAATMHPDPNGVAVARQT